VRAANYESLKYVRNLKTYKDRKHHETPFHIGEHFQYPRSKMTMDR
jgi:hypothetical protein